MLLDTHPSLQVPTGIPRLLADLIQDHLGLYFDDGHTDNMLEKLSPLVEGQGFRSFLDYYYLLKYEGEQKGEWQRVMEALSVQETYFWREMDQIRSLVDVIVPDWFARGSRPLRIWSAACATGEEPFTIALALAEAGWLGRVPIEIVGSDASVAALEKARRGTFQERAFRQLPPELRAKYFQRAAQGWCIAPELLVRVRFQRANLVAPGEIAPLAKAAVIFCRNVFIYFSEQSIRRTVGCFSQCMPREGHLFVGASESLLRITQNFSLEELGGAFVYKNRRTEPPAGAGGCCL